MIYIVLYTTSAKLKHLCRESKLGRTLSHFATRAKLSQNKLRGWSSILNLLTYALYRCSFRTRCNGTLRAEVCFGDSGWYHGRFHGFTGASRLRQSFLAYTPSVCRLYAFDNMFTWLAPSEPPRVITRLRI
jgi:hypothetical protein